MRRGIVIGVVGLLTLVFVSGAAAQGRTHTEVLRPNTGAFVYLGKAHGYELRFAMPTPRIAVLYVSKTREEISPSTFAASSYAVRVPSDALKRGLIRARFPSLGRVSLRFEPSGKRRVHRGSSRCRGRRGVREEGTFRGTVSLEGEDGYFRAKAHSGEGILDRSFRRVCKTRGDVYPGDLVRPLWSYVASGFSFKFSSIGGTVALLYAVADEGGRYIGIRAAHYEGAPPGAEIQLQTLEWRSGMAIGRLAYLEGGAPGTLTTSMPGVHPAFATLAPPSPFHGEGDFYENSATSHSWTGTLGVSLPGLDLPLTGEEFKTSLCVVSPLKTPDGCDFVKTKPVRGARVDVPPPWRQP